MFYAHIMRSCSGRPGPHPDTHSPWILTATSTTSAPASAQASMAATPAPAVSCVCTWMGTSGKRSLRAPIRSLLLSGFSRPAMSWMWRWKETCQWHLAESCDTYSYQFKGAIWSFGEDILNQERKIVTDQRTTQFHTDLLHPRYHVPPFIFAFSLWGRIESRI